MPLTFARVAATIVFLAASGTQADAQPSPPGSAPAIPPCTRSALHLDVSDDSPGMGRIGILVSLRNASSLACDIANSPTIAFANGAGTIVARAKPRAGLALAPGATVFAHAVWSDGAGGNGPCVDAAKLVFTLAGHERAFERPFSAHLCAMGEGATPGITAYAFSRSKQPATSP
jgi:hypothetical protein